MNKGVHPKASKSKLKADRLDSWNYCNYKNDCGKNTSCHAATGHKLFSSPGILEMDTFLMNMWNTPPESYQQSVYNNTLATVKRQIQKAENPTPAMVISVEAAHVDNGILHDNLTPKVALQEPEIRSTDLNIPIGNNLKDDELHFGKAGVTGDYNAEVDQSDERNATRTARPQKQGATELEGFDLGTSDVDRNEGEDADNADANEEEEASQADALSTDNVEG